MHGKNIRKVGDYQIIGELGEGLTSCVYKAIKKNSRWGVEQTVALKILKSRDQVQTLAQEISLLSSLDSQHCVKMLGWIEHGQHPAIILEYLNGITLCELLKQTRLTQKLVDEIVAQIQSGLLDLQKGGLRHGDLSPRNIFITQTGLVKLLDFGFSGQKSLHACTYPYLAIEGWRGQPLTWESDLYSLGLLKGDIESGGGPMDREEAQHRAEAWKGRSSLLEAVPQQRHFLPITSDVQARQQLAEMVQQIQQNKKKNFFQQTALIQSQKLTSQGAPVLFPWLSQMLMFVLFVPIFLFSQTLHPANVQSFAKTSKVWKLEVRSLRWAQITLYHLRNQKTILVRQQYTPFVQTHLTPGRYQIRWQSQQRAGLISVQLNKNQRILLP